MGHYYYLLFPAEETHQERSQSESGPGLAMKSTQLPMLSLVHAATLNRWDGLPRYPQSGSRPRACITEVLIKAACVVLALHTGYPKFGLVEPSLIFLTVILDVALTVPHLRSPSLKKPWQFTCGLLYSEPISEERKVNNIEGNFTTGGYISGEAEICVHSLEKARGSS